MTKEEREKAIRKLTEIKNNYERSLNLNTDFSKDDSEDELYALELAIRALEQEPREHGEWIYCDDSKVINLRSIERIYHKCSKCGHREHTDIAGFNFCPRCGADMRKQEG